jgi:mannose-6-phosphate isomerase-like protein (cupin superfamily)
MRRERPDERAKGWLAGPWDRDSDLQVSVGFANEGVDEPHAHTRVTEIYLVARGTSFVRVETETIELSAGDVLIVEPGEAHTFLGSSPDYLHFVVHSPGLADVEAQEEKRLLPRARLGL